ncbi:methyltransferase-like protein 24 isoform X1 [Octopus sinensis]|uniref:Methyltransferase-like protein 24 isoform X1 n=1 Tax=Octopus sinensis TaxID=2607531 RepID=A0A6P7SVH7_9MOLL|nr:methyltransferase-like protein 24 isoform X1 [Octopus sinensis]XP_036362754.1 methyltransferase-like protein 24 isoform X1 [Octopus sinensis]
MIVSKKRLCLKAYILTIIGLFVYLIISSIHTEPSPILPSTEELDAKSASELEDLFHGFMSQIQVQCNKIARVGSHGDGGWNVCLDKGYFPMVPCLVYSFGIGLESSFDVEMQKIFSCEVHSFDPFVNKTGIPNLSLMNFHSIGIMDRTDVVSDRVFMTLSDIRKYLNHTENVFILKMDIEMAEWRSLTKAISDGELDHVKQLLVEFHVLYYTAESKWNVFHNAFIIIKKLMDLNFRTFSITKNEDCNYVSHKNILLTRCYNVHMIKVS